jgi:hypothetical protein
MDFENKEAAMSSLFMALKFLTCWLWLMSSNNLYFPVLLAAQLQTETK